VIELPKRDKRVVETPIVKRVIVRLNRLPNVWAARNNVGELPARHHDGWIRFGLGDGSPDVVGVITIGGPRFPIGVAFGVEVKTPHRRLSRDGAHGKNQEAWRRLATSRGMLCGLARSEDEAETLVEGFRVEMTRRLLVLG